MITIKALKIDPTKPMNDENLEAFAHQLVAARLRNDKSAWDLICDEVEPYLVDAPLELCLIFRERIRYLVHQPTKH